MEQFLTKVMMWVGTFTFPFIQTWRPNPNNGEARVVHFAKSEGDFNTACRQRVEWLDGDGYNTQPETELDGTRED